MTKQLLIYREAMPVSAERHGRTSIRPGDGYGYARDVNSVPVTASEFASVALEHPIVFTGEEDVIPSAVLGARAGTNDHVDADGRWTGRYVPAFLRRYPFVFGTGAEGDDSLYLHLDEAFEGVNADGRGERLFDDAGERTQYLGGVLRFLEGYQAEFEATRRFCRRLVELDLLTEQVARLDLPGGAQHSLRGFKVVDRARLKALPGDVVQELFASGGLECLHLHLASTGHFVRLAERLAEAGGADGSGDADGADGEDA